MTVMDAATSIDDAPAERPAIPLADVRPSPYQPRHDLALDDAFVGSIREHGIVVPVIIHRNGTGYVTDAGHRRIAGAVAVGRTHLLPGEYVIRDTSAGEDPSLIVRLENAHRRDLNPLEWADIFAADVARGATHARVSDTYGVSRAKVTQYINLRWSLEPESRLAVLDKHIPFTHARQLGRLADPDDPDRDAELRQHQRTTLVKLAAEDWKISSRRLEAWITAILYPRAPEARTPPPISQPQPAQSRLPDPQPTTSIPHSAIEAIVSDGDDPLILHDIQASLNHVAEARRLIKNALTSREYGARLSREVATRLEILQSEARALMELVK